MAIFILILGAIVFFIGIAGQLAIGRHFNKQVQPGDRRGARLVLTLAAIIIGAWLVIASASALLHAHAHAHSQQGPANPS